MTSLFMSLDRVGPNRLEITAVVWTSNYKLILIVHFFPARTHDHPTILIHINALSLEDSEFYFVVQILTCLLYRLCECEEEKEFVVIRKDWEEESFFSSLFLEGKQWTAVGSKVPAQRKQSQGMRLFYGKPLRCFPSILRIPFCVLFCSRKHF